MFSMGTRLSVCKWILILAAPLLASPLHSLETPAISTALFLISPDSAPPFLDDHDFPSLKASLEASRNFYSALPSSAPFYFGSDMRTAGELKEGLEDLVVQVQESSSPADLNQYIRAHFDIYRSCASPNPAPVVFSAYHEYSLSASLSPDRTYRYPLYARPKDLFDMDVSAFDRNRRGERWVGRLDGTRLLPYYSREEIDSRGALFGRGLEIAWAKSPLDILFLQIQGSGQIELPGSTETLHIRYAGDNGRPYKSVGQYLIESGRIPRESFSRAAMEDYLRKNEKERQMILNQNPRYVFFEIVSSTNQIRGALLAPLTAGRSIASDPKFYPPGALAWISTLRPVIDKSGAKSGTAPLTRFVLNQDEGGAIKGASRIDFFAGGGREAQILAQNLWYPGELYFFVKKRFP